MKEIIIKSSAALILLASYLFLPKYGFPTATVPVGLPDGSSLWSSVAHICATEEPSASAILSHLLYPLSHANVFHLAANILCLFMLRCRTHIIVSFFCAVLCSFLPCPLLPIYGQSQTLTIGFSGVLFAMVGISWGKARRFRDMLTKNKYFLIIPAFLPHVNFLIHIYCLLLGYLYGRAHHHLSLRALRRHFCRF